MNRTVIAVGLPRTGKTTFLAAFWEVVNSAAVVGSLQIEQTHGDMEYLNAVRRLWGNCKKPPELARRLTNPSPCC